MKREVIRIIINCDNRPYELFSLRVSSDGSIIVVCKKDLRAIKDDGIHDSKEHRYSIHPSNKSELEVITIKRTTKLINETVYDSVQTISRSEKEFCAIVFHKACAQFIDEQLYNKKKNDREISIGQMSIKDHARLHYVVTVCSTNFNFIERKGFSFIDLKLSEFRIRLYYCFENIPATNNSYTTSPSTSPQRRNGIEESTDRFGPAVFDPEEINDMILDIVKFGAMKLIYYQIEKHPEHEWLEKFPLSFHPNINDLKLGRYQRNDSSIMRKLMYKI